MPVRLDFPGRCEAIEHFWIDRQSVELSPYQVEQIDIMNAKMAAAIMAGGPDQDALYQRLGDFEARLNLLR